MQRVFMVLFLCLTFVLASSAETQRRICFQRNDEIWVANIDGSSPHKIGRGSAPNISPDGTRIAFHTDSGEAKKLERRIAVAAVGTGKVTVFNDEQIPSDNCQAAIWSPSGEQILFNIYTGEDWHIALVNADGSGFRYVKKATPKNNSFWSACWSPDGKSIYAQDLNKLYQFALDGSVLKKWKLESLFPKGSFSSGSRFDVSPDGKTLLMTVDMEEGVAPDDWDGGPPPTLWKLDLATEKTTRLSPIGTLAMEACWLSDAEILYVTQRPKEKTTSIYEMPAQGGDRKLFLKNAGGPTVSK